MRKAIFTGSSAADSVPRDAQHQPSFGREGQIQLHQHSFGVEDRAQPSGSPGPQAIASTASPLADPRRKLSVGRAQIRPMPAQISEMQNWSHWADEQNKRCSYNRPLLLIDLGSEVDQPILVPIIEHLRNASGGIFDEEAYELAVQNKDCYLFDRDFTISPRKITTNWVFESDDDLSFFDTFFHTWNIQDDRRLFIEQVKLAALLWNGLVGDPDQALARKMMSGVYPEMRGIALRQALCHVSGQRGAIVVPTLLSWGADINATSDDDDWTSLMSACELRDLPMIETLVRHGANLSDEFGAHISVAERLADEDWKDLVPLIEAWKNQPLRAPENTLQSTSFRDTRRTTVPKH